MWSETGSVRPRDFEVPYDPASRSRGLSQWPMAHGTWES